MDKCQPWNRTLSPSPKSSDCLARTRVIRPMPRDSGHASLPNKVTVTRVAVSPFLRNRLPLTLVMLTSEGLEQPVYNRARHCRASATGRVSVSPPRYSHLTLAQAAHAEPRSSSFFPLAPLHSLREGTRYCHTHRIRIITMSQQECLHKAYTSQLDNWTVALQYGDIVLLMLPRVESDSYYRGWPDLHRTG